MYLAKRLQTALSLVAVYLVTTQLSSMAAGGSAQNMSVKMGYFNLNLVKATYPESATATALEERAKDQLRRDVEQANSILQEMQKQNKTKDELEKKARELQIEISAKQQALGQLLANNTAEANRAIASAVNAVAKEKGLDMVIDGAGIFAGADKLAAGGEDVTELVVKRLNPSAAASSSVGSSKKPEGSGGSN